MNYSEKPMRCCKFCAKLEDCDVCCPGQERDDGDLDCKGCTVCSRYKPKKKKTAGMSK